MTLDEAKTLVRSGAWFGEVFPALGSDAERDALRHWFTRDPGVPPRRAAPVSANGHAPRRESTGDACPDCGGFSLVRTGSCVTCQDCGRNEGCG